MPKVMVECIEERNGRVVGRFVSEFPGDGKKRADDVGRRSAAIPNLVVTFSVLPQSVDCCVLLTYLRLHPARSRSARVVVAPLLW